LFQIHVSDTQKRIDDTGDYYR